MRDPRVRRYQGVTAWEGWCRREREQEEVERGQGCEGDTGDVQGVAGEGFGVFGVLQRPVPAQIGSLPPNSHNLDLAVRPACSGRSPRTCTWLQPH